MTTAKYRPGHPVAALGRRCADRQARGRGYHRHPASGLERPHSWAGRHVRAPSTDQTKTTGLVTLPGAFVGAIFGGVSPLEAGRFEIVVLASIMAAGSITAVLIIIGLAAVRHRPRPSQWSDGG